jgi:hypothetical protein
MTFETFLERAAKIHPTYTYDKTSFTNGSGRIRFFCQIHGWFTQGVQNHLHLEQGCPECGKLKCQASHRFTKDQFVAWANVIHEGFYDYTEFVYINAVTKGTISCPYLIPPEIIIRASYVEL